MMLRNALFIFLCAIVCACTSPRIQDASRSKQKEYIYVRRWDDSGKSFQQRTLADLSHPRSFKTSTIRARQRWDRAGKLLWEQSFSRQLQLAGMETEEAPIGDIIE